MNIDFGKAIKELLYQHDAVILPGLGGFVSEPAAAVVDYVQSTVQPPSKKLDFNPNLVINDGVLVNYIQKTEVVTAKEAQEAIEAFTKNILDSLEKREIVDLPGLGRLYKDYEQKIRFMPEGANFNVDSFGLPAVSFKPIARKKTASQTSTAATAAATATTLSTTKKKNHWAEKLLPWLIILAAVLLAFSLYVYFRGGDNAGQRAEVPQERVNVKPSQETETADIPHPADDQESSDNSATDPSTPIIEDETDSGTSTPDETEPTSTFDDQNGGLPTDSDTATSGGTAKTIFIVVHSFGSRSNARKFVRTLERNGYEATSKKHGGLYRVGVEIPYRRQSAVDAMIKELGAKFKSKPVAVDY
ncbi:MAG TPA: hypothetical protein ENJ95_11380 [Bacteroidetes bacterium]|nr:hypothetical protein [Bacteroidota bacterium]